MTLHRERPALRARKEFKVLVSKYEDAGPVVLPSWRGRQLHMRGFNAARPTLPAGYEDYLAVVAELCKRTGHTGVAYLTVDEKIVQPGQSQRRPGAHVDGTWMPDLRAHGQPSPRHHPPSPPGHIHGPYIPLQSVIVAASVSGCVVYPGQFDGTPKDDGDLEHIRDQFTDSILLPENTGFLLSPDCVHESIRFDKPTQRTFLRIALESGALRAEG